MPAPILPRPLSFAGTLFVNDWDNPSRQFAPLGLAGEGSTLTMQEEQTKLPDTTSIAGGSAHIMIRATGAELNLKLFSLHRANLARALYGDSAAIEAQTIKESLIFSAEGVILPLARIGVGDLKIYTENFTPNTLIVGSVGAQIRLTAHKNYAPIVTILEPAALQENIVINVLANRITITLSGDVGGFITTTIGELVAAINTNPQASALLTAEIVDAGSTDPDQDAVTLAETPLSGSTGEFFDSNTQNWELDVTGSGIYVPTGSILPKNTALIAEYTSPAQIRVDALKTPAKLVTIMCLMQNRAMGGTSERITFHKVQFGLAAAFDLLKKDHNSLDVKGEVLRDTTAKNRTLNGTLTPDTHSEYYHWEFIE
jgi:hypothetical protein